MNETSQWFGIQTPNLKTTTGAFSLTWKLRELKLHLKAKNTLICVRSHVVVFGRFEKDGSGKTNASRDSSKPEGVFLEFWIHSFSCDIADYHLRLDSPFQHSFHNTSISNERMRAVLFLQWK